MGELRKGKKTVVQVIVNFTFGSCVLTTCEVGHLSDGTHWGETCLTLSKLLQLTVALRCSLITCLDFTIWDEIPQLLVSFDIHWSLHCLGNLMLKWLWRTLLYCSATWFWEDQVEKEAFLNILLSSWLEVTASVWVEHTWNGTQYDMWCTLCNLGYLEDELWDCQCKA